MQKSPPTCLELSNPLSKSKSLKDPSFRARSTSWNSFLNVKHCLKIQSSAKEKRIGEYRLLYFEKLSRFLFETHPSAIRERKEKKICLVLSSLQKFLPTKKNFAAEKNNSLGEEEYFVSSSSSPLSSFLEKNLPPRNFAKFRKEGEEGEQRSGDGRQGELTDGVRTRCEKVGEH